MQQQHITRLDALAGSYSRIHTHLQTQGQHTTAQALQSIFGELKGMVLELLQGREGAPAPSAQWPQQVLALLDQIKETTQMTDKNVDTILNNWGPLKTAIGQLISLAQEAVEVEPDDPRAEEIAKEMEQLNQTISPIVATPAPSSTVISGAVQGAASAGGTGATGATGGATGATGQTGSATGATAAGATGALGATGTASASTGVAGAPATGSTGAVTGSNTGGVTG